MIRRFRLMLYIVEFFAKKTPFESIIDVSEWGINCNIDIK